MCNLYSMTATIDEIKRLFGAFEGDRVNLPAYDEIYPNRAAPVLRRAASGELLLDTVTWGFPGPAAAKGRPITNVRNLESPFWRAALGNPERRCLVPVTSFSEWTAESDPATGRKRKVWFGLTEPLFAFAGIWRPGEGEDGGYMAFLTCAPNRTVGAVHPKAMPVILRPDDHDRWCRADRDEAMALAKPYPDTDMRILDRVS